MKKIIFVLLSLVLFNKVIAQQYSLYNSRTLFDSFENPSQKAFQVDSSRQFAFNFFIPGFGFNTALGGPAKSAIKSLVFDEVINSSGLTIGERETSRAFGNMNLYLGMFKLYTSLGDNTEVGASWQIRSDNEVTITNESIAIFDNYKLFDQDQLTNAFNNKGFSQTYHQLGLTYRKDFDSQMGLGIKLNYLSGIAYNDLKITSTDLTIDSVADYFNVYLRGRYRTNFLYDDQISKRMFLPGFKNPGLGFSASMNYRFRGGWYVLANLKDIGFIKWSNKSYIYNLDKDVAINNASASDADTRLLDELNFHSAYSHSGFITPVNGKAELLINKDLGFYQPNLLLSKNLFYNGGDIALMNNFNYRALNFSFSTAYNTSNILQVGSQFMIKSPNVELYVGSDQLYKTVNEFRALYKNDETLFKGYPGASLYFGFSAKFGYVTEHHENTHRIPRVNEGNGIFDRILRKLGLRL